jgi:hypothetical protein
MSFKGAVAPEEPPMTMMSRLAKVNSPLNSVAWEPNSCYSVNYQGLGKRVVPKMLSPPRSRRA